MDPNKDYGEEIERAKREEARKYETKFRTKTNRQPKKKKRK